MTEEEKRTGRKIVTEHVFPPIPIRSMDWAAWFDGDEPNDAGAMLHGEGPTEEAAIADLMIAWESAQ